MFLSLVSFTTVLPFCCSFPPCTAMYCRGPAHPFHAGRSPPETTLLTWQRYWSGLKINQPKGADVAKCRELCRVSWVGQCTMAGTGRGTSDRAVTPGSALLGQMAPEAPRAPGDSGNSAPCTGDPVRTGKGLQWESTSVTLRSIVKKVWQKRLDLENTKHLQHSASFTLQISKFLRQKLGE